MVVYLIHFLGLESFLILGLGLGLTLYLGHCKYLFLF